MASEIESVSGAEKNYKMIERVLLANVEEQRRARRWGLFWRFATFFIFLVVLAWRQKWPCACPTRYGLARRAPPASF